jgi:Rrf2 family protein
MLVASKKLFCCIEAVLYIAYNAKSDPISGGEIAQALQLPSRYLEPMMQKLVRAGILRGVRGPAGGYLLGRERRRITLADICSVLSEDDIIDPTTPLATKILRPTLRELNSKWTQELSTITIATLCERASAASIRTTHETATDFII